MDTSWFILDFRIHKETPERFAIPDESLTIAFQTIVAGTESEGASKGGKDIVCTFN